VSIHLNSDTDRSIRKRVFHRREREARIDAGIHFQKSVLTGWALTANPANPECVRMLKSLGARTLDLDREVIVLDDEPVRT